MGLRGVVVVFLCNAVMKSFLYIALLVAILLSSTLERQNYLVVMVTVAALRHLRVLNIRQKLLETIAPFPLSKH